MPKAKKRRVRPWRMLFVGILFALICTAGYFAYSIYSFADNINNKDGIKGFDEKYQGDDYKPPVWEGTGRVNVLLLGADSRGVENGEPPRSDTLMIASIDPVTKKASLMSILRDTWVKIPGNDEGRINSAFTIGGPNLAMKTVSELTGIPIQYYLYTDFKGFIALVDAVGGIDLEVEKDMKYTDAADGHVFDINLKKGMQHLDGQTALQYVRFRHDAQSDYARTERQRKFLTAVADKMQSTQSILKLPSILKSMEPYINTNMSFGDMVKLGGLAFDARAKGIQSIQLPPENLVVERRISGAQVLSVDKTKLKRYIDDVFEGMTDVPAAGTVTGTGTGSGSGSSPSGGNSGSSSSGTAGTTGTSKNTRQ